MIDPFDELTCLGHDEPLHQYGGSLMPPIVQTSLFAKNNLAELMDSLSAEHENLVYSRGCNPTVASLEEKLAKLERGETAKCFSSGMGAVSAVLCGLLKSGDHVVFANQVYGPTLQLAEHLQRFGVTHTHVPHQDLNRIEDALKPNTRLLYFESPGTMLFRQLDIKGLTQLARSRNILTAIDNTWATPLLQKPLEMGVDLSIHSLTKYVGGHSDTTGGVVVGPKDLLTQIFYNAFLLNGAAPAPFNAFLLIRGLRTLPTRLRQHQVDALALARFLQDHPAVEEVFHPGLHTAAEVFNQQQLRGFSGLFSFALKDGQFKTVSRLVDGLKRFRIGVSWGGVESLVISPNRGDNIAALKAAGLPPGLVRLSVGLEGSEILKADLAQALEPMMEKPS